MQTITTAIGPTFADNLLAASLGGLPIVWSATGVDYDETVLTSAQVAALEGVISATNPTAQSKDQIYAAAVAAGFTTGLGWMMALDGESQQNFSGALSAANAQIALFQVSNNANGLATFLSKSYPVPDIAGALHSMTTAAAMQLLLNYYSYAQEITLAST